GFERTKETFEEAVVLAERLGDPELLARAALGLAGPGGGQAPLNWANVPLLERALAALGDGDSALRAQVMARLAGVRTYAGTPEGTEPLARAAIEMARRVGDPRALAYVLSATPWAIGGPDDVAERLMRADELIRLADEAGDERLAAEGHSWKAGYYLEIGDIAAADRELATQQRLAETSRQAYYRWTAALNQGGRAVLDGRFDESERLFEQRLFEIRIQGQIDPIPVPRWDHLQLEQQGRTHDFLPDFVDVAATFPKAVSWRGVVAWNRVAVGETEAARGDLAALAVNQFRDLPRNLGWLQVLSRLADVVSFFGDAARATVLYDLLLPYADRCALTTLPTCRGSVARPLGLLATVLGRYDAAERHFEDALAMNARIRARIWVAHTQHDYARMLVARDGPGD